MTDHSAELVCPTCGPTKTEQHPRRPHVTRCVNCKEWLPNISDHIAVMLEEVPKDWWRFVPCAYCNARRQEPCQVAFGPARQPHAPRRRSGLALHATIWLLTEGFADDVLGVRPGSPE